MAVKTIIGQRIRTYRSNKQPKLSIHKLAVLAEVDPGQLSRAERGLSGLSIDAIDRIANVLQVSLSDLLNAKESSIARNKDILEPAYQLTEYSPLIMNLTQSIWQQIQNPELSLKKSEQRLIQHQIHAAIVEGIHRGKIQAEQEMEIIHKKIQEKQSSD